MQAVLWDIMKAEAFTNMYVTRDTSKKIRAENARLQQDIFAIHHITKADFDTSYKYYQSQPEIMIPMIDSMIKWANKNDNPENKTKKK
jgi:hypothetical protein